jgi:hypothetical protein
LRLWNVLFFCSITSVNFHHLYIQYISPLFKWYHVFTFCLVSSLLVSFFANSFIFVGMKFRGFIKTGMFMVLKFVDFQFLVKKIKNNVMQSYLTLTRRAFYLPHVHIFTYHTALVNKFNPCLFAFITQKSAEKRRCKFVKYIIETWQVWQYLLG